MMIYIFAAFLVISFIGAIIYFLRTTWHCDKCHVERHMYTIFSGHSAIIQGKTFCGKCAKLVREKYTK